GNGAPVGEVSLGPLPQTPFESNCSQAKYEAAVEACKEYIRAGDIFQVVLSQRLAVQTEAAPFDIYRALRVINPSPFMFYLKNPETILVGSSPEILCRVEEGVVTNRPLAGTRRRGNTEAEDRALRDELLADPKERAEHVMLIDLVRNDLGRFCQAGSIKVTEKMVLETYEHVHHIVSNIEGQVRNGTSVRDIVHAVFPGGTITGCPKVRCMEIISELEQSPRGAYTGSLGYIGLDGQMDLNILIRTLLYDRNTVSFRAGAGIVHDSVPEKELMETRHKAKGLLNAIKLHA
ncbi:MAG: anthranilate synthase component I family protein, partial [Proteobacteria bacterium]|nr:anthranilate synthase component I family protein [Pseudomonadota bacterium]